jgi:hypothetical protein
MIALRIDHHSSCLGNYETTDACKSMCWNDNYLLARCKRATTFYQLNETHTGQKNCSSFTDQITHVKMHLFSSFLSFCFVEGVPGFKLRVSHLIGRHSTAWVTLPVPFCSGYFGDKFSLFCPAGLQFTYFILSVIAGITSICPSFCLRWDPANFLPRLSLNAILPTSVHQAAKITGINHRQHPLKTIRVIVTKG